MKGFTLIEVLIAMSLFSIMVVLLFGSLQVCANSWHKGETKIAAVNEMAVVSHFFQQHLATTQPLFNTGLNGNKNSDLQAPMAFQGKRQSIQFTSAFPASVGRLGVQLFTISLKTEDGKQNLKVKIIPLAPLNTNQDHEEVVLLNGVRDFSIAYFGADDATNKAAWRDDWQEKNTLPRLLKITIKLDNGLFFPDMLIALKITEPPVLTVNTPVITR